MPLRVERILDHRLYPPQAIADAGEAFRDHCELRLASSGPGCARVVIEVPGEDPGQAREVALSCLNYALDRAAQILFQEE
jgi:hypothetical protein